MPILLILWKFKYWVAIAVFFFLWVGQLAYSNYLSSKLKDADAECAERINKVNDAYQGAINAWRTKVSTVKTELEAERQNIKIQFRDIKYETQKVITQRIYTDCKLTDDGMRIAEAARIAANSSKHAGAM